jgi:hypothetical protein
VPSRCYRSISGKSVLGYKNLHSLGSCIGGDSNPYFRYGSTGATSHHRCFIASLPRLRNTFKNPPQDQNFKEESQPHALLVVSLPNISICGNQQYFPPFLICSTQMSQKHRTEAYKNAFAAPLGILGYYLTVRTSETGRGIHITALFFFFSFNT